MLVQSNWQRRCAKDADVESSNLSTSTIYASVAQLEVQHSSKVSVQRSSRCRGTKCLTDANGRHDQLKPNLFRVQISGQAPLMGSQLNGRATALQAEGCGFNSHRFHHRAWQGNPGYGIRFGNLAMRFDSSLGPTYLNPNQNARITQLGEYLSYKQKVGSSSLSASTILAGFGSLDKPGNRDKVKRAISLRHQQWCSPENQYNLLIV